MWVVAVELDSGRRVVFGREGAPTATPAEAVRASCAIPAYFEPPLIDGPRYVDGGVHSTTNADLVADEAPDLVLVSAPMSAVRGASPRFGPGVAMRQIARLSLSREVAGLRGRGIPVVAFQPTAADLAVMGSDSLDPAKLSPVCAQVFETTCHRLARVRRPRAAGRARSEAVSSGSVGRRGPRRRRPASGLQRRAPRRRATTGARR